MVRCVSFAAINDLIGFYYCEYREKNTMPFQRPWRNYVADDLLYGLAQQRAEFANHIGAQAQCTIDQYEIATADRGRAGIRHDPAFVAALSAHGKYNTAVAHADVGWDLTDQDHWNQDWLRMAAVAKRKCKGGLDWITHNTTRHIHFCLDGLDLVAAASKSYDGSSGGVADAPVGKAPIGMDVYTKARSITGAELRWVYRNRNNSRVRAQVQFWRRKVSWAGGVRTTVGWEQCPPPWNDVGASAEVRAAWAAYSPTTMGV